MPEKNKEHSFGVIPLAGGPSGIVFLVVRHRKGHWGFPKGHRKGSESEIDAAEREFREETGIGEASVLPEPAFMEDYRFRRGGEKVEKSVKYFLGFVRERTVHLETDEIQDARWVSFEDALGLLTFPEARRMLQEVKAYLDENALHLKKRWA